MSMDIYFATPPVTNPNASIASVALKHGLNANLVSKRPLNPMPIF